MSRTVGNHLADRLVEIGLRDWFGVPGHLQAPAFRIFPIFPTVCGLAFPHAFLIGACASNGFEGTCGGVGNAGTVNLR